MANPTSQEYSEGNKLIAGEFKAEQVPLGIDTYYRGMRLEYQADGTPVTVGTGSGVGSAVIAGPGVKIGAWVFTFTAALVGDLTDPDGNVIAQDLTCADGAATTFDIAGLKFTLTDGSTAWVATDTITMTIEAAGTYVAIDEGQPDAIYNGPDRILGSAGVGSVITGGEIYEGGLVTDANVVLTMTEAIRAALRKAGFAPRKVG